MSARISVGLRTVEVPDRVLLDSNFLISACAPGDRNHQPAVQMLSGLLQAAATGAVAIFVTPRVIDEVWWRLAALLWDDANGRGSWGALDKSGRKRAFRRFGPELRSITESLVNCPVISVTEVILDDIPTALAQLTAAAHTLEPADAFHVAVMQRLEITGVVTNDRDFLGLPNIVALNFGS
jgi:predicted nucleic acid-binding protein